MKLETYLSQSKTSNVDFSRKIGTSAVSVHRYARGKQLPEPHIMLRIVEATAGAVTANDFYGIEAPQKVSKKVSRRTRKAGSSGSAVASSCSAGASVAPARR